MQSSHKIIRLVDLLENSGESLFTTLCSSFCSPNKDVEHFLKEKAVQSAKLCTSSTYLVISKDNPLYLSGYFSLAMKMLSVKKVTLSKAKERTISRFGYYDADSASYKIPAVLIAQFGRNFNEESVSISGDDLMAITLQQIREILSYLSG